MNNQNVTKEQEEKNIFAQPEALNAFDTIITKGALEKTVEVTEGLSVLLRPLTAKEQLVAETTRLANDENVGVDTLNRFRGINILSMAIQEVNGQPVDNSQQLFKKLMELPSAVINVLLTAYTELIQEQAKALGEDFVDAIKAF